jgi:hypothetical protein
MHDLLDDVATLLKEYRNRMIDSDFEDSPDASFWAGEYYRVKELHDKGIMYEPRF